MNGNEDHSITLEEAAKLTRRFQNTPFAIIGTITGPTIAEAFGRDAIEAILDQSGCTGIRIYYGLDLLPSPSIKLVLVGVNSDGDDLYEGELVEKGDRCPGGCSSPNPLNS